MDLIDLGAPSITKYSRYKSSYINVYAASRHSNPQEMEAYVIRYIARRQVAGIVPADIGAAGFLHSIRHRLPGLVVFPVSAMETLELLDDKWQFAELLRTNSIEAPATLLLKCRSDLNELEGAHLAFPLVVKTLRGESGHGVIFFESLNQLRTYLNGDAAGKLPLIAQEYVRGVDADISILAHEGVVHAHIFQLRATPGILEFAHNEKAVALAKEIVRVTNYSGVANIDLRIDPRSGQVKVIECNPRFWYTLQASLWRGLNFVAAGLDLAEGRKVTAIAPDSGRYYYHGYIARRILSSPKRWGSVPNYNWRGFWQAASDPLPFLVAEVRGLKARFRAGMKMKRLVRR